MSNQLATLPEAPAPLTISQRRAIAVGEALADGMTLSQLAHRLADGDRKKERAYRREFSRMASTDPETRAILTMTAGGDLMAGLPRAARALSRRASRGYIPAIKLLFEATGFHNPRVQHEHTGEISVRVMGIERAPTVPDVVDATVVEDDPGTDPVD